MVQMLSRFTVGLIAVLALATPVRAEPALVPQDVFDAYPTPTITLPQNGKVAMFGADVPGISFTRAQADGTLTLDHEQIPSANEGIYLINPGALVAGEPLLVTSSCPAGCGFTTEWTVSDVVDDVAPEIAEGPVATNVEAIGGGFGEGVTGYDASITLPIITDNFGPTLVLIEGEGVATRVVAGEANASTAFLFSPGADARTECYRVRAIDVGGNETVRAEDVCVDLDPSLQQPGGGVFGCTSTSASATASGAMMLLALLALRARRPRSPSLAE